MGSIPEAYKLLSSLPVSMATSASATSADAHASADLLFEKVGDLCVAGLPCRLLCALFQSFKPRVYILMASQTRVFLSSHMIPSLHLQAYCLYCMNRSLGTLLGLAPPGFWRLKQESLSSHMTPCLHLQAYCLYRMNRLSEALALLQSGEKTAGTLQLEGQVRKLGIQELPGIHRVPLECYEHATEMNQQALLSHCCPRDKMTSPTGRQHRMRQRLQEHCNGHTQCIPHK